MKRRWLVVPVLALGLIASAISTQAQEKIKDRKGFIPSRKQVALKGTEIGILLTDGQPVLSIEGRSGPADQLVFSSNGNSYRWVYVPTQDGNPQITNLQVPIGDKGEKAVFGSLNMANPQSVLPWAVRTPYALVEVEVNTGRGSPANDSFVGTSFKVLDGSKDFPLKTVDVIKQVKVLYADYLAKQQKVIDQAMTDGAKKSLNGKAPTGPREKKDLMYVTWLTESQMLRIHLKTTISDGAYSIINNDPVRNPPPLKLPPRKIGGQEESPVLLRAAPPRNVAVKVGTTFGIEIGRAYIVNKMGEVVGTEDLLIEPFTQQLNTPFIGNPRGGPRGVPIEPGPPQPADKESI